MTDSKQSGFTLIEIAVVLVIVGLLVGSFIGSFAERIESSRRAEVMQQLEDVRLALYAFAATEGRLPCPATGASNGVESPAGGGTCAQQLGFVPGATLGLEGSYDQDGLLLDAWGNPLVYVVSSADSGSYDYTTEDGVRDKMEEARNNDDKLSDELQPALQVCEGISTSTSSCAGTGTVTGSAVFILLSRGGDGAQAPAANTDQAENADGDRVFVAKNYVAEGATADVFDDMLIWGSPYILYAWMLQAGQIP